MKNKGLGTCPVGRTCAGGPAPSPGRAHTPPPWSSAGRGYRKVSCRRAAEGETLLTSKVPEDPQL